MFVLEIAIGVFLGVFIMPIIATRILRGLKILPWKPVARWSATIALTLFLTCAATGVIVLAIYETAMHVF